MGHKLCNDKALSQQDTDLYMQFTYLSTHTVYQYKIYKKSLF